jgi:hypothetical protein
MNHYLLTSHLILKRCFPMNLDMLGKPTFVLFLCNVHFCEKGQYKGNPREREFSDSSMHILLSEIKVDNSRR